MELTKNTTVQEIYKTLRKDIMSYVPEEGVMNTYCLATAITLSGRLFVELEDKHGLLWEKGVRIVDVFDDRETPDKAIKFYLKSENVETHLLFRTDDTISLEINDIGSIRYEKEDYEIQRIRVPGGDTLRRIVCEDFSHGMMMRLIMETKW